jgi:hypothetical protein
LRAGVREWNFTLRGMNERDLFAAAEWACQSEVWDRCINTSDRTARIDLPSATHPSQSCWRARRSGSTGLCSG